MPICNIYRTVYNFFSKPSSAKNWNIMHLMVIAAFALHVNAYTFYVSNQLSHPPKIYGRDIIICLKYKYIIMSILYAAKLKYLCGIKLRKIRYMSTVS